MAVTVIVEEPIAAEDAAVSVSVDVPLCEVSVTGFLLHEAVTPEGSPLTLRFTAPLKVLLPAKLITSVIVLPCATETEVEAAVAVSVGGIAAVTVMGRFTIALKVSPVLEITFAVRLSVDVPATAVELPVNVSVQATAPEEVTVGALRAAVIPLGSPETTLIVEPVAPVGKVTPPPGVAVTVTAAVPSEVMETVTGELLYWTVG